MSGASRAASARRRSARRAAGSGSNFTEIANLVANLGELTPATRRELRVAMLRAGQQALQGARSRASWSSRIPSAIQMQARTGAKTIGVFLRVDAGKAPHGRPFEGITDRRPTFRHPVFGDREVWVAQATRPFLAPAVKATQPAVMTGLRLAVQEAGRAAGFR